MESIFSSLSTFWKIFGNNLFKYCFSLSTLPFPLESLRLVILLVIICPLKFPAIFSNSFLCVFWVVSSNISTSNFLFRYVKLTVSLSPEEVKVPQLWGLCNPMDSSMEFSRPEYWSVEPFPSPGNLPTQVSNPGLPHCSQIFYQLSHRGRPRTLEWVAYPFFRGSSQPRNWTRVSCIAGRFFYQLNYQESIPWSFLFISNN